MKRIFYLIPLGLFLVSLLGFMGNLFVPIDLFSHFRLQYFVLLLLCLAFFLLTKKWLWSLLCVLFLGINAFEIAPLYLPNPSIIEQLSISNKSISVLNINIEFTNRNSEAVLAEISRFDADVVVLVEYTEWWKTALEELSKNYPYREYRIQTSNDFGLCVYSKLPLSKKEIHFFNDIDTPILETDIDFEGEAIKLFAFHPPAPVSSLFGFWGRDKVYKGFASFIKNSPDQATIIVGDFNASSFSYIFKNFIEETQMRNSQLGFGWQGSWPRKNYPLHVAIDHCLMSNHFICTQRETGNITDSDHLPVFTKLKLY